MSHLKKVGKGLLVAGAIMMLAVPAMAAGKQSNTGSGQGTMTRDRLRTPGACKNIENIQEAQKLAHNGQGAGDGSGPLCICIDPSLCHCESDA